MAEEKKGGLMKRAFGKKEPEKPEFEPLVKKEHDFEFVTVDEELAVNKYYVDEENPHIVVKKDIDPEDMPALRQMVVACPAALWRVDNEGNIQYDYAGCLECGACRLLGGDKILEKGEYPRGGFGIEHRYG